MSLTPEQRERVRRRRAVITQHVRQLAPIDRARQTWTLNDCHMVDYGPDLEIWHHPRASHRKAAHQQRHQP